MSKRKQRLMRFGLATGLIMFGGFVMVLMMATRPRAARAPYEERGTLVKVQKTTLSSRMAVIRGSGEVVAAERVDLQPEVSGRIVWISPNLVPGGRFDKGEPLVRVDPRDFELALEQQRAAVEKASVELQLEEGRKTVAAREWETLSRDTAMAKRTSDQASMSLALREPQVRAARLALRAADSGLRRAQLNLGRTTLRAPFDAVVQSKAVDLGQVVSPQARVATLVGTQRFWVQVSVPVKELRWMALPANGRPSASALVWQNVAGQRAERRGRVIRLLSDLDPVGRMARLLVEIDSPLDGAENAPLFLGSYVQVEIEGQALESVVAVPRSALRDGDTVYLRNDESRLEIRRLDILRREREEVVVEAGLNAGESLIISQIPTPVPNMLLRSAEELEQSGKITVGSNVE